MKIFSSLLCSSRIFLIMFFFSRRLSFFLFLVLRLLLLLLCFSVVFFFLLKIAKLRISLYFCLSPTSLFALFPWRPSKRSREISKAARSSPWKKLFQRQSLSKEPYNNKYFFSVSDAALSTLRTFFVIDFFSSKFYRYYLVVDELDETRNKRLFTQLFLQRTFLMFQH